MDGGWTGRRTECVIMDTCVAVVDLLYAPGLVLDMHTSLHIISLVYTYKLRFDEHFLTSNYHNNVILVYTCHHRLSPDLMLMLQIAIVVMY